MAVHKLSICGIARPTRDGRNFRVTSSALSSEGIDMSEGLPVSLAMHKRCSEYVH